MASWTGPEVIVDLIKAKNVEQESNQIKGAKGIESRCVLL
jgi:hypothetical protein